MEPPVNQERMVIEDDTSQNHPAPKLKERGQWATKSEYFFSVVGEIVGVGNVWRFPYLCFKNGGGAFLVPYVLFLFACGIPMFFLELSLGQLTSQGGVRSWRKICPLMEGIGYGTQMIGLYKVIYYIVILAWAFLYLISSFSAELPWAHCNNTWNTGKCAVDHCPVPSLILTLDEVRDGRVISVFDDDDSVVHVGYTVVGV
ncbi:sodium- and chloride-dependent betaine transporter-like [Thalassophryne amazonica]|uniref:sodium- and chloride-dependent betaine transporter-like n=1 Tax=Thalassophryne amazonica TaxID=390379 RepID=UPI001470AADE|nr:sodium- and chloride-dependent betaine transporter-like [Thalassophryne amazonica]